MPDIKTSMMIKRGFNMAEYLKEFIDGENILAAETNANNNYLLDQIRDSTSVLTAKINSLTSQLNTNLQAIYPIGAIYIGTTETCPIANLFGTWEKVSEGRVLQGADEGHEAGTTIPAGLPNVSFNQRIGNMWPNPTVDGAMTATAQGHSNNAGNGGTSVQWWNFNFNGSRSSSVYGQANTVQPPAFVVNIWRRTA